MTSHRQTITSTTMTGARTPHTARKAPGRTGWEVWSIPGFMHTWFCVTQLRQVALL